MAGFPRVEKGVGRHPVTIRAALQKTIRVDGDEGCPADALSAGRGCSYVKQGKLEERGGEKQNGRRGVEARQKGVGVRVDDEPVSKAMSRRRW